MECVKLEDLQNLIQEIRPNHKDYYYLQESEQQIIDTIDNIIDKLEKLDVINVEEYYYV